MNHGYISMNRTLAKLDEYLHKNDYAADNVRAELLVQNEHVGLFRKLCKMEQALNCVSHALTQIDVRVEGVSMPVVDSLGEKFLHYVKGGMKITAKAGGGGEVE